MHELLAEKLIRDVPDFPKPGIVFKDITPVLESPEALQQVVFDLKENKQKGADFLKMPYEKIKIWMNLPLNDGRTKITDNKKIMRSFRLNPETIHKIELLKKKNGTSEAAIIEGLVEKAIL
jgi:hypothetical protein